MDESGVRLHPVVHCLHARQCGVSIFQVLACPLISCVPSPLFDFLVISVSIVIATQMQVNVCPPHPGNVVPADARSTMRPWGLLLPPGKSLQLDPKSRLLESRRKNVV